jgi:sulfatase modifying factor 1
MDTADGEYGCNIKRSGTADNYSYSVASDWANRPVNCVSFWNACRFTNWLHNGQGNGDTETGAYTLNGYNGTDGRDIQRNSGWSWAVASENEWFKAAYYKVSETDTGYGVTQHRAIRGQATLVLTAIPTRVTTPTTAGEFENSASSYGTFDQGGNVWEWSETIVPFVNQAPKRVHRGGSFGWIGTDYLAINSFPFYGDNPNYEDCKFGFRVVQAVPEPSSILALISSICGLSAALHRKRGVEQSRDNCGYSCF